jgi:hypothetical protein
MNNNLLTIILLLTFLLVNIAKRLHTAFVIANLLKQQRLQAQLQLLATT